MPTAQIATVALNPGRDRRCVETLSSLGADARSSLTNEQCDKAIAAMQGYFRCLGRELLLWWRQLDRITQQVGFSYGRDEVVHLDLVQEWTEPVWGELPKGEQGLLLRLDLPFLEWELQTFPPRVLVCNGARAFREVLGLVGDLRPFDRGKLRRVGWWAGVAKLHDRSLGVVGWNLPLDKPTGLGSEGEKQLGGILSERLQNYGIL